MAKSKATVVEVDTKNAVKSLAELRQQITSLRNELYTLNESSEEYQAKLYELDTA